MEIAPKLDNYLLFILLVFPGLLSMHIYRLIMPAKDIDWKHALTEALFYSSINFGLALPVLLPFHQEGFYNNHPVIYIFGMMIVLLITPIVWPYAWSKLIRSKKLMSRLQLPYPSAWDYFFDQRRTAFLLIHLKNGKKIGGYYGPASFATSFPREGDVFLEASVKVDDEGHFLSAVDNSIGLLIKKEQYDFIEFFQSPGKTAEEKGGYDERKETSK